MSIARKGSPNWTVHPGEILEDEFLKPMGVSRYMLAKSIHVSAPTVNEIVLQRRSISPETSVRLAKFFGTSEQFWLNLQAAHDVSKIKKKQWKELDAIRPFAISPLAKRAKAG